MKRTSFKARILALTAILFAVTSCCMPCSKSAVEIGSLEENTFRLVEMNLEKVENSDITLTFDAEEKMVLGTAPCNNFFGGYKLFEAKGNERNIEFYNMGSTKKLCPDSQLEEEFVMMLARVKRVELEGGNLLLIDTADQPVAVLVAE